MSRNGNWWTRKLHRWGAVICGLPLLLVITSGILLQVKKQSDWVQPPTQKGSQQNQPPTADWPGILSAVRQVEAAEVEDWNDIDRLDVRPSKGIVKVQCANRWEVQLDLATAEVLSSTYRRSDLIESLHDGSIFSAGAKLWVFLPNGLILLGLWISGAWLWYLPVRSRRRQRQRRAP